MHWMLSSLLGPSFSYLSPNPPSLVSKKCQGHNNCQKIGSNHEDANKARQLSLHCENKQQEMLNMLETTPVHRTHGASRCFCARNDQNCRLSLIIRERKWNWMSVVKLFRTGLQVGKMSLEAHLLEMHDAKDAHTLRLDMGTGWLTNPLYFPSAVYLALHIRPHCIKEESCGFCNDSTDQSTQDHSSALCAFTSPAARIKANRCSCLSDFCWDLFSSTGDVLGHYHQSCSIITRKPPSSPTPLFRGYWREC